MARKADDEYFPARSLQEMLPPRKRKGSGSSRNGRGRRDGRGRGTTMEEEGRGGTGGKTEDVGFKFNADAPEFVPRVQTRVPTEIQGCCYFYGPWLNFAGDGCGSGGAGGVGMDWVYFAEQDMPRSPVADSSPRSSPRFAGNSSDALHRIVKQVEYQFTDANLGTSDYMMKLRNKDPEGYVPISAIVSNKKVKSLGCNNFMLAKALRTSSKLDVSEDGKKVRRKIIFSVRDKEELQLRTVVVENLPEACSRPKLEKIFNTVGRVRNIKICYPHEPTSPKSYKTDVLVSNKMHALVEYDTIEQAEKAAEKLNDERNWRKGLRVRVLVRRTPKSVIRNRRGGDHDFFNDTSDDDEQSPAETPVDYFQHLKLHSEHTEGSSSPVVMSRSWSLGRVKSRGAAQVHSGRGVLSPIPHSGSCLTRSESSSKLLSTRRVAAMDGGTRGGGLSPSQQPHGSTSGDSGTSRPSLRTPRMPDGTRGFTMGRGKPLQPAVASCVPLPV